jgi:hypothetical protein
MTLGTHGNRPEVALYQLTLKRLGYDPGAIDGQFGDNTIRAAIEEAQTNSPDWFNEIGVDEGIVLDSAFHRLGIACS